MTRSLLRRSLYGFALPLAIALSGCAGLTLQFRALTEPPDTSERARLRVIANAPIRAYPNSSCIAPFAENAGTIFNPGGFGSKGFRGRSLDMPRSTSKFRLGDNDVGELYVAADEPLTLHLFLDGPGHYVICHVAVTFVPQANQDYEATLLLDRNLCKASVTSLSQPDQKVDTRQAERCP